MRADEIAIEVRGPNLDRVGVIPDALRDVTLAPVFRGVGSWSVTLPAAHPMADALRQPGYGIVAHLPGGHIVSGPTIEPGVKRTPEDPGGRLTVEGATDEILLAGEVAYPQPANPDPATQRAAWHNLAGPGESVMRGYVDANIGPTAPAARRSRLARALTVDEDLARGARVSRSERFTSLLEICQQVGLVSNLGFRIVDRARALRFEIWEPVDRSRAIRLDVVNGALVSEELTVEPPGLTHAIVLGHGEGEQRLIVARTSAASRAAEELWGWRISRVIDQRQGADRAELEQAGDEALAEEGFTAVAAKAIPSDAAGRFMELGRDYWLGDTVALTLAGQEVTAPVTGVAITSNADGTRVAAAIGDVVGFDDKTALAGRIDRIGRRMSAIERNA